MSLQYLRVTKNTSYKRNIWIIEHIKLNTRIGRCNFPTKRAAVQCAEKLERQYDFSFATIHEFETMWTSKIADLYISVQRICREHGGI